MHIHCAAEEISVAVSVIISFFAIIIIILTMTNAIDLFFYLFQALLCLVDKKTGEKSKTRPRFVKQDQVAIMRIECSGLICLEEFKRFPQMGRFTLRDESKFDIIFFTLLKSKFVLISILSFLR